MSKSTTIDQLAQAYSRQRMAMTQRSRPIYKDKDRWLEIIAAQRRRVLRKMRRSVGKSNKLGCRATASSRAVAMCEVDLWAQICRNNRRLGGLNDQ